MKKDNFDLRAYLVENKMTENSRGEVRRHLGETTLDTRMLNEVFAGPDDHGYSEFETWYADHADEFDSEDEAYSYWENNVYGQDAPVNDDIFADLEECPELGSDVPLAEQGYSEAEGDDEDPLANFPSLEDIIKSDPNAKKAERAATRDIERAAQAADQDDAAAAADDTVDGDAPVDDEPAAPQPHPNKWVTGDLTMDSLFGADAPNVDILVGDDSMSNDEALQYLFRKNKNYRPNLLQAEVRSAMKYFQEFEKPDKLYLIPAIDRGGYTQSRFNPGNRAVAVVYRPEELSGDNWANQFRD